MGPGRDAFGRLVVDPSVLSHGDRVDVLRRLAGSLQAADDRETRWLGASIGQWLRDGGDLARALGLRPRRGSHRSAQYILATEHRDRLLVRLVSAVGQSRAARILSGAEPAPAAVVVLVEELQALRAPTSRRAIVDAVRRARG